MFKKIAVAAALAIVASSSFAAGKPSFYVGGDVGSTKLDGVSDRSTSFGAFAGYEFMPNFAVEVGVHRLADVDLSYAGYKANVKLDETSVSLIAALPLGQSFNVFGRLGYANMSATASSNYSYTASDSGAIYGVGVGYAFTPTISGRAEILKTSSDSSNLSVGVSFKF